MMRWSDLPKEIQKRLLDLQEEQGNPRNENVFRSSLSTGKEYGGVTWNETSEGDNFWQYIIDNGDFDVIVHGCNCFCTMSKGIAVNMAREFYANEMKLEEIEFKGDINKLGCIDYHSITDTGSHLRISNPNDLHVDDVLVTVVNAYT